MIRGQPICLLGAHVLELALQHAVARLVRVGPRLGDSEIDDLHVCFVGYQDVARRHIAMNDSVGTALHVRLGMGVVQALGGLLGDERDEPRRQVRSLASELAENVPDVFAIYTLHGDEVVVEMAAEVVHPHHVRMLQRSGQLGFIDEHVDEVHVVRDVRQDPLDYDELLVTTVRVSLRLEDLGHAARGDAIHEVVLSEYLGFERAGARVAPPRLATRRW